MKLKVLLVSALIGVLSIPSINLFAQSTVSIQCGDIVEGEVVPGAGQEDPNSELGFDDYLMNIQAGTRINLTIEPLGGTFNPTFVFVDSGNNDVLITNDVGVGEVEQINDYPLGSSNQVLRIYGVHPLFVGANIYKIDDAYYDDGDDGWAKRFFGAYAISIGCTLRDGTVIEPGEVVDGAAGGAPAPVQTFSGYGFAGLQPVDFSAGIEIPLTLGQAQTAPIGGDVVLYTHEAGAGSTATLTLARASGEVAIGVTVISKADNSLVFMGGLPTSNNLSVELTFPTDGTYSIGLFRLSGEATGAVQISLQ